MKSTMPLDITFRLLLAVAFAPVALQAQSSRSAPASAADSVVVAGRVVTDPGRTPIRGARVMLSPDLPEIPVVTTDATGRFQLPVPRASLGRFALAIIKAGYVRGNEPLVSDRPVEVRLQRGAAIAGRVSDQHGDPLVRVLVAALKQPETGKDRIATALATTDERGEYRLYGLPEGAYVVCVRTFTAFVIGPQGNRLPFARTTYHPGTTTLASAQLLNMRPGTERPNVDIVVGEDELKGMPATLFDDRFRRYREGRFATAGTGSVHGRVVGIDGTPVSSASIYLFARERYDSQTTTTDERGEFRLEGVTPGPFLLSAVKNGFVQVEAGRALETFNRNRASSTLTADDERHGRSLVLAADEQKDVDLQLARCGTVNGVVTDEHGDPVEGIAIQVFRVQDNAAERRRVFLGSLLTDDRGRYRLYNLAPGAYAVRAGLGATRDVSVGSSQAVDVDMTLASW